MSEQFGDPNIGAKSVLTALAGLSAALTSTMVAEPVLHGRSIDRILAGFGEPSQLSASGDSRYRPYRWTGGIADGGHSGEDSLIMR